MSLPVERDLLFDVLPLELQFEITRNLDGASLQQMRLVNRRWNEGVKNIISFDYKQATLTDKSADHILSFPVPIRTIEATNLMNRRKVMSSIKPFGVVHLADKLILGKKVDPVITRKLLKTATEVRCIALSPVDPMVGEAFLRFPALFDNVTHFELKLNLTTHQLKEEELFLRKLSHWRKFPNLLQFGVSWTMDNDQSIEDRDEVLLMHSIYISVHNFLHTHRDTVQRINWDFSNLLTIGLPDYLRNIAEYTRVKKKMTQVSLKEVEIIMSDMEGQEYWDLNKTLLRNQFSLTMVAFTGCLRQYSGGPHCRLLPYPFGVASDLMDQNQFTLTDLYINNRVFSFYSIENCRSLKKLVLKGASIVSTTPLGHLESPKGIEELQLDFQYIFPPDVRNLMNWFPKLLELKVLNLQLKMQWTASETFPTNEDFPNLLKPPKLSNLILRFDASTGYKLHMLKLKVEVLKANFEKIKGIKITSQHVLKEHDFTMFVNLDRKVFKGIT